MHQRIIRGLIIKAFLFVICMFFLTTQIFIGNVAANEKIYRAEKNIDNYCGSFTLDLPAEGTVYRAGTIFQVSGKFESNIKGHVDLKLLGPNGQTVAEKNNLLLKKSCVKTRFRIPADVQEGTYSICVFYDGSLAGKANISVTHLKPHKAAAISSEGISINVDYGQGYSEVAKYSFSELQSMQQIRSAFSSIDSMPSPVLTACEGISLVDLIRKSGVAVQSIQSITFIADDGYSMTMDKKELLDTPRYYYPLLHSYFIEYPDFSLVAETDKLPVDPVIALLSFQSRNIDSPPYAQMDEKNSPRLCYGQKTIKEANNGLFVKFIKGININSSSAQSGISIESPSAFTQYAQGDDITISGNVQNIASVNISIFDSKGKTIDAEKGIDTSNGFFSRQIKMDSSSSSGIYIVEVSDALNRATCQRAFNVQDNSNLITLIEPRDNQAYFPGDKLVVSGKYRGAESLSIAIDDTAGNHVYSSSPLKVESVGSFLQEYELPRNIELGAYVIKISGSSDELISHKFSVIKDNSGDVDDNDTEAIKISGSGLSNPYILNRSEAERDEADFVKHSYSTINRVPAKKLIPGRGIPLKKLLEDAGANLGVVRQITIAASDGYEKTLTAKELFDTPRYSYPNIMSDSDQDAVKVPPIIALESGESETSFDAMEACNFKFMLGQRSINDQNNSLFVKDVISIKLSSKDPGQWKEVICDPPAGIVSIGTTVNLNSASLSDSVKIYFTTDGSTPDINSKIIDIENEATESVLIDDDTTIKAITSGPGKNDSDICEFHFMVDSQSTALSSISNSAIEIEKNTSPEGLFKMPQVLRAEEDKTNFNDVKMSDWYVDGVIKAVKCGVLTGYPDGSFHPNAFLTRAELAVMIVKAFGIKNIPVADFSDTRKHWGRNYIGLTAARGIMSGYDDGKKFYPDKLVTREEIAVAISNAMPENATLANNTSDYEYIDFGNISFGSRKSVEKLTRAGVVSGYSDKTFRPDKKLTRAEAAAIFALIIAQSGGE